MNVRAMATIYRFEMVRFFRTLTQSFLSPVLSASLYFIVFGAAIGPRMTELGTVGYAEFLVPGIIMLSVMTQSISNAAFSIFYPKFIRTTYELLSAPISFLEILGGYVGAAATKSFLVALVILTTSTMFVDLQIIYPLAMLLMLILTCLCFALFGFIIGIWADNFEQLQIIPLMIVTPMVFLGGSFYSISVLPPLWQTVTLFNPVVYLISGFRWTFYGQADVPLISSVLAFVLFSAACLAVIWWIFRTGWKLRS